MAGKLGTPQETKDRTLRSEGRRDKIGWEVRRGRQERTATEH